MPDDTFAQFVVDQLSALSGLASRRMFGGYCLSRNGRCFAIVYQGRVFFKVCPGTVSPYRRHGMQPFRPNRKQTLKTYYEVPADIVEEADALTAWAEQALSVPPSRSSPAVATGRRKRSRQRADLS